MKKNIFFKLLLGVISIAATYSCSSDIREHGEYVDGIAVAITHNWQYTYINASGERINPEACFAEAKDFSDGFGVVRFDDDTYGLVDKNINVVTTERFKSLSSFSNGYAVFSRDGEHFGILNKELNVVLQPVYLRIFTFSEGLARVYDGSRYGFIDTNLKLILPCEYSSASDFGDGISLVEYKGANGWIDTQGHFFSIDADYIYPFVDGMAKIRKKVQYRGELYGFVNKKGVVIVPCEYDEVLEYSEGLVAVCKRYKSLGFEAWTYFDKEGNIFAGNLDHATSFSDGKAEVVKNNSKYYLKRDGSRGATIDININGRWRYYDPAGGNTFTINGTSFELWENVKGVTDSGTVSRNGNTLTLHGRSSTYTINIDLGKQTLVWQSFSGEPITLHRVSKF